MSHFPDKEWLGLVLDTGHAHLNLWNIPEVIHTTKDDLLAIHINDNDGMTDIHLAIGDGTIDWPPVFNALKTVPTTCQFILEYNTIMPYRKLRAGKELLLEHV